MEYILKVEPHTKPRMTIRDKWKHRECVDDYYFFKDMINIEAQLVDLPPLPGKIELIQFHISMPKSWSQKNIAKMDCTPHQQTPDCDNLLKSIQDSLIKNDCHVYSVKIEKFWAKEGFIKIIF